MAELLAPAGDLETLKTALYFGADAVYIGGPQLQLRADKAGFTKEQLVEGVEYTHSHGKKIYVTVNSFAFDEDLTSLPEYARFLYASGVDAVIVADVGVMATIHEAAPELEIHISTQFNCTNTASAKLLHDAVGAKRVVTAREMTLEKIKDFISKLPPDMDVETFVHGAICMSFSGRCILSSYFNGRSANRGDCTQPCRWKYYLMEEKRDGVYLPIEEQDGSTAVLSSHDMNTIDIIDEIVGAGVASLKIEGRMKSEYYVATIVNAYRMRLDGKWSVEESSSELEKVTHRPYSAGFYHGYEKKNHNNDGDYHTKYLYVGKVLENCGNTVRIQQRNAFCPGDELEILMPGAWKTVHVRSITDLNGNPVQRANLVKQVLLVAFEEGEINVHEGDLVRRKVDRKVEE